MGTYYKTEQNLISEAYKKMYVTESRGFVKKLSNGCKLHDAGDVFVVTDANGKNIGQCRTEIEAETIADGAGAAKDESVSEGASEGTVTYFDDINGEEDEFAWEDFKSNIKSSAVCQGTWVALRAHYHNNYDGTFGPRTGDYSGISCCSSSDFEDVLNELIDKCRGCNYVSVEGDGKTIEVSLSHHDGTETYKLVKLNKDGEALLDEYDKYMEGYSDECPKSIEEIDSDKFIVPVTRLY